MTTTLPALPILTTHGGLAATATPASPMAISSDDPDLFERVLTAVARVEDPELPVGLVDLGLVRRIDVHRGRVTVGLTYTSLACPCVEMIREDVAEALAQVDGVAEVEVTDVLEPWSRDDITLTGRALLKTVAVV